MINGPIPGESLTGEPKGYAWERPPEITDPDEAIIMHLSRLQDEDRMNTVLDALEFGMVDLSTLVKGIMRSAVANGIHTIDVGLIAAPLVHQFIKRTADELKIDYDDGVNKEQLKEEDDYNRQLLRAKKQLEEMGYSGDESFERDDVVEEDAAETIQSETVESTPKKGLMSRPNKGEM